MRKVFQVNAAFVGSTTAKLIVNEELSPKLEIGSIVSLNDSLWVTLINILPGHWSGGRKVEFNLTREIVS